MGRTKSLTAAILAALALSGCMKWEDACSEQFDVTGRGLFIVNEGNFQYGNATLSFYNPATRQTLNEVFFRANGMRLGDVAQSMTIYDGRAWVVVNNSHVIFAIDPVTFREIGRIENLTSPRYIHFVSPTKAYVSQIWDNRIFIVDPSRYAVTGYIEVPGMSAESGSTEQMVRIGDYVYCNCWSYNSSVIKIDTRTDRVVASLQVGLQPNSLVRDCHDRLWTITDGGYEGSPTGYEAPRLVCIDTKDFSVERSYTFRLGDTPSEVCANGAADTIYWINRHIWRMPVDASAAPRMPFLTERDTKYYGLTVDPVSSDVYVADAIDYQQQGIVYRYSSRGNLLDEFYTGVTPAAFCWKK